MAQPGAHVPHPPAIEPLMRRVASRDSQALAELYDRTSPYVFGLLRRMLATAEQAEEVAQEVYIQVWRTAGTFDPERGSAWSWLVMMARSRAVDRMRADGSYRGALESLERDALTGPGLTPGGRPDRDAALAERSTLVREALGTLPAEQAEALTLAFFGGLSHREIADRTGMPLGTVKTRIRAAMMKLHERLAPVIDEEEKKP